MSVTTDINAPIENVWSVLCDVACWSEWMPTVEGSATSAGTAHGGVGAQYDLDLGGIDGTITYTVTQEEAPYRLVLDGRHLGSSYTVAYELSSPTPATTRLVSTVTSSGMGKLMELTGGFDAQLRQEGDGLKARVEGEQVA